MFCINLSRTLKYWITTLLRFPRELIRSYIFLLCEKENKQFEINWRTCKWYIGFSSESHQFNCDQTGVSLQTSFTSKHDWFMRWIPLFPTSVPLALVDHHKIDQTHMIVYILFSSYVFILSSLITADSNIFYIPKVPAAARETVNIFTCFFSLLASLQTPGIAPMFVLGMFYWFTDHIVV